MLNDGGYHHCKLGIDDLLSVVRGYLAEAEIDAIYQAYQFSAKAHEGQQRKTGEAYIYHPLAVAHILAEIHSDVATIKAALLHDVIEDTPVCKDEIARRFGDDVAQMVDGVSKLEGLKRHDVNDVHAVQPQHENFRKMMLAMTQDIRVIVIKLADRLHNMRTLYGMRPDKQRRIAEETRAVYVPIAKSIGMYGMMLELEDLSFQSIYPWRRQVLAAAVSKRGEKVGQRMQEICQRIEAELVPLGIHAILKTREKSLFSIYRKMRDKHMSFEELNDIYALRIITDSIDGCYRALGVAHMLFKPLPGKFKDYIAIPKSNGYQSLHTVLFLPGSHDVEIQIRTHEMDEVAETGIASHWMYKGGDRDIGMQSEAVTRFLVGKVESLQENSGDSREFMENLTVDLIPDNVYVFTPKGKILELPRGATALDFAYAVHTDIGSHAESVWINERQVPFGEPLRNGQTVRVETSETASPLPSWLNFVATGRARSSIRYALRKLQHLDAVHIGKRMLERSLQRHGLEFTEIDPQEWKRLLRELHAPSVESLYESIGQGNRLAGLVVKHLLDRLEKRHGGWLSRFDNLKPRNLLAKRRHKRADLQIYGTEGMAVSYARCCYPLPGDAIVGFAMSGRGIVVHKQGCRNLKKFRKHPEKLIDLHWHDEVSGEFDASLSVTVVNRPGTLAQVSATVSALQSNIDSLDINSPEGGDSNVIHMVVKVTGRKHLADMVRALKALKSVKKIRNNS
jgi:GTP diphosphokinase / guanosine-3',5'-bis(diphosphate) 3'-diphosphatase